MVASRGGDPEQPAGGGVKGAAAIDSDPGIALSHTALPFGRTAQGVHHTGNLDEQSVAGRFDQPTVMCGDLRIDHLGADRPYPVERAFLVSPDQRE
jgi:hypothetical protein